MRRVIPALCLVAMTVASIALVSAQTGDRRLARQDGSGSPRRVALVIGNDSYAGAVLQNGRNDARAMATALREVGFTVTLLEDANQATMGRAIADLADSITARDVALFYFAGHGLQVGGENYLVPVDYRGTSTAGARFGTIAASQVQETLAKASVSLIVLDACRNNPYSGERGASGLAPMEVRGSLVAFATGAGQTASDSVGSANGLFTRELLTVLKEPNLNVRDVFYRVRQRVYDASSGRQFPAVYDGLLGDLVLRNGPGANTPPAMNTPPSTTAGVDPAEIALWNAIEKSTRANDFDVYLQKYPNGAFAELARSRRANLKPESTDTQIDPRVLSAANWFATVPGFSNGVRLGPEVLVSVHKMSLSGCEFKVRLDRSDGVNLTMTVNLEDLDLANASLIQRPPTADGPPTTNVGFPAKAGRNWNVLLGDGRTQVYGTRTVEFMDSPTAVEALRRLREVAPLCAPSR